MKTTRYILAFVLALWCANLYAITSSYYTAIDGKSGSNLRDALYDITKVGPANGHSYNNLWTAYKTTDVYPSDSIGKAGKIWDMYSNVLFTVGTNQCGSYSNVGDCYNREHSLPKSWFNDANPAYYDLGHIVPTDGKVNGQRSNYPFGECASGTRLTNGTKKSLGKLGTSTFTGYTSIGTVFEPDDIYKGDFARMYFYMVVRYKPGNTNNVNLAAKGDGTKMFNSTDDNYGLTDYSVALLLKWHRQDPVSQKEIDRNNGMQTVQNNRNPFIDYPELVEYLWGNNAGQAVNLSGLTLSDGSVSSTYNVTLYRHGESEVLADKTGFFTLPTNEPNACDNWVFDGWSTAEVTKTTTRPTTYVTTVNSASILWAVYAKTESSGSAPHRATMATSEVASVTFKDAANDGSDDKSGAISDLVSSESGISSYSGSKVYAGTTGVKIGSGSASGSITLTLSSAANVKSVVVNAKKYGSDSGKLSVKAGSTAVGSAQSPNATAGDLTFTATTAVSNTTTITVASSKRAYIKSITVIAETSGGGSTTTTYYASEPEDCNCTGQLGTPAVTATPSDGTITLMWDDVSGATNGYSVTIDKGVGYTTECGAVEISEVTHSGTTNTCVITGLVNGLSYTTSVVANGTTSTCESAAGTATATPVGCNPWDITFGYSTYILTAGGATVSPTVTGTQYGAVTYESSNTSVLTVNASGVVTPVSAGTATVTAHWSGDGTYCPKDVTTSTFTVNGKVIVTFDKNDGSGTTTTQQVDYNTATALTANIFNRTGYTFLGWATEASGAKVYNDGASITITAATTLYAVWQANTHMVTFSPSPTGATVKVNNSSSSPVNSVSYGSTVTIVITPAAHYTVSSVTADSGVTVTGSGSNWSFTMPDKDVAITVTMVEDTKYTVNWYVSDTPTEEVNYAGEALAGIANPTIDCNGKVFMGWTATADYSDATIAPADLFTDASTKTMPSNNSTNYYAVFAEEVGSTISATFDAADVTELTESPTKTWIHDATGITMQLCGSSSRYTGGTPNTWTMSHIKGSKTVITSPANITQILVRSVYQYTSGNKTYNGWVTDASAGTLSPTTFASAEGDGYVTQTITNVNAKSVTIQDNSSSAGDQARVITMTVTCSSTTYSDYSTSCSAPVLYEITVNDTEHGSITTLPSETAASGSTVTVTITPDEWYNLVSLTVEDANGSPITVNGDGNTRTFTMPESNVTISATFVEKQKYAINFYVEGTLASLQNVYEGSTPNVPSDPTPCDGGYTFVGWWTNTLDADNTTAQTWITDFTASQAQDYYAVFSYSEGGGASSVTDKLTRATTGSTGTSYKTWSGKTLTSDAVYAGQSAGSNTSIQLRSKDSNSGIITTASGGKVTKVTVEWNSNTTSGRTLNVYGKNTAYSAATDLYGDNAGTLLGTIVCGTSTELTVTGDYAYVGLRSDDGAMYLTSVSVTWSAGGASTTYYTTSTCSASEPIMMVSELDGAYYAVTHEITESAIAARELIGLNDTYYYKPGTNTADITWYIQRGRASNYLSNSTGMYLAVEGKNIAMRAERFAWTVNDAGQFVTAENTGLCYDSKNRAFVVADQTGNDANNWHLSVSASEQRLTALQEAKTYTRSGVTDDQYITICLPYAISQTFLETAEVYNVTRKFVSGSRVTGVALTPEEGILVAGRPYVVHTLSSPLHAYYGEITAAEVVPALGLVGNLSEEPLTVPAGCYGLSNSRLRLVTEGGRATTGQYKAYFDLRDVPEVSATDQPMGSKMMYTTDATETPTDVDALSGNSSQINWQLPVYNVLGIQVGEDATGVLIQNGIKYLKY